MRQGYASTWREEAARLAPSHHIRKADEPPPPHVLRIRYHAPLDAPGMKKQRINPPGMKKPPKMNHVLDSMPAVIIAKRT